MPIKNETLLSQPKKAIAKPKIAATLAEAKGTVKKPKTTPAKTPKTSKKSPKGKTSLTIKFDCGYENFISIRGEGAGLNWEKGIPLKNIKNDEWLFEPSDPFTHCEYKVLLNDTIYENGLNRTLVCGTQTQYTPFF